MFSKHLLSLCTALWKLINFNIATCPPSQSGYRTLPGICPMLLAVSLTSAPASENHWSLVCPSSFAFSRVSHNGTYLWSLASFTQCHAVMFSWGWFCSIGDIWQSLETFLVDMIGRVKGCCGGNSAGVWWVELRMLHWTTPTAQTYLAPNVDGGEAEKPCCNTFEIHSCCHV